jgi:hypothetical protein
MVLLSSSRRAIVTAASGSERRRPPSPTTWTQELHDPINDVLDSEERRRIIGGVLG